MKKYFIFFAFILSNCFFSQEYKEVSVTDSLAEKYPERNENAVVVAKIFTESQISKDAVSKVIKRKFKGVDLKTLTKEKVNLVITYYRTHYLWILIDNSFQNFTNEELETISKNINDKKSKELLIKKFRLIEKQCIKKFESEF